MECVWSTYLYEKGVDHHVILHDNDHARETRVVLNDYGHARRTRVVLDVKPEEQTLHGCNKLKITYLIGFLSRGDPICNWNDAQVDYDIQVLGVVDHDNSETRLPYEEVAGYEDVLEVQIEPLVARDRLIIVSDILHDKAHLGTSGKLYVYLGNTPQRSSGRPLGGIESINNAKSKNGFFERAVCRISKNRARVGNEKPTEHMLCISILTEKE